MLALGRTLIYVVDMQQRSEEDSCPVASQFVARPMLNNTIRNIQIALKNYMSLSLLCTRVKLDGCIVWNPHNTVSGSKRPAICALAVYFLHSTLLVSRDSIVDRHWLPATDCCQRYLPCCQPVFDVAENLERFLVWSVHPRGMTLN